MKVKIISLLAILLVGATGCELVSFQNTTAFIEANDTESTSERIDNVVTSNNNFGLSLLREVEKGEDNTFLSPYSLYSVMALAYEGGAGGTAESFREVLGYPNKGILRPNYAAIYNRVNREGEGYELHSANAAWLHNDFKADPEYTDTLREFYRSESKNLDFSKESSANRINRYIQDKTNG